MKIDKKKLLKSADIAKTKADNAKAAMDTPTLQTLLRKIIELEARIKILEAK
jgi:hypothetical protein